MTQYQVTVIIDASCSATVEANSPEEAAAKAMEEHGITNVCHQCAQEFDVGDAVGTHVYDADSENLLLDTTFDAERIASLEAEVARLRAALEQKEGAQEDAARWRMLPAFFEEYQIDAMKLYRDIDAALAQKDNSQ